MVKLAVATFSPYDPNHDGKYKKPEFKFKTTCAREKPLL